MDIAATLVRLVFRIAFGLARLLFRLATSGSKRRRAPKTRLRPFIADRARAVDGDTLAIGDLRVRIFGIDAPEITQRQGRAATTALSHLISGHRLKIIPVEYDRYDRLVARIRRDDGADIGAEMVAEGYARAATRYSRAYCRLERRARAHANGLWSSSMGMPDPAAYRAAQRARGRA